MPYTDTDLESNHSSIVVPQRRAACTLSPTSLGFSIENIRLGNMQYEHVASLCACRDLAVYVDFGSIWTLCADHDWQCLGTARRIYTQSVRHA